MRRVLWNPWQKMSGHTRGGLFIIFYLILTSGILHRRHSTRMSHIRNSAPPTFHPNVSHQEIFFADIPSGYFTSGVWRRMAGYFTPGLMPDGRIFRTWLDAGWERRAFQLPWLDISGSSNSIPGEFRSHFAQCCGVLLKLPDMCDRHFEIFCFRYLMSVTDILRYFASDIWCLNSHFLLIIHLS